MTFKNVCADEILNAMAETLGINKIAMKRRFISLQEYKDAVDAATGDCEKLKDELHPDNVRVPAEDFEIRKYWQPRMIAACVKGADDKPVLDKDTTAALNFALQNLVKVADVLDTNGFEELASLIDEDILKITNKTYLEVE